MFSFITMNWRGVPHQPAHHHRADFSHHHTGGVLEPVRWIGDVLSRQDEAPSTEVSLELVATELVDTDLLVGLRYGGGPESDANFAPLTASPVWQSVPAVVAGNVVYLDVQEANGNLGLAGVEAALDDRVSQLR